MRYPASRPRRAKQRLGCCHTPSPIPAPIAALRRGRAYRQVRHARSPAPPCSPLLPGGPRWYHMGPRATRTSAGAPPGPADNQTAWETVSAAWRAPAAPPELEFLACSLSSQHRQAQKVEVGRALESGKPGVLVWARRIKHLKRGTSQGSRAVDGDVKWRLEAVATSHQTQHTNRRTAKVGYAGEEAKVATRCFEQATGGKATISSARRLESHSQSLRTFSHRQSASLHHGAERCVRGIHCVQ